MGGESQWGHFLEELSQPLRWRIHQQAHDQTSLLGIPSEAASVVSSKIRTPEVWPGRPCAAGRTFCVHSYGRRLLWSVECVRTQIWLSSQRKLWHLLSPRLPSFLASTKPIYGKWEEKKKATAWMLVALATAQAKPIAVITINPLSPFFFLKIQIMSGCVIRYQPFTRCQSESIVHQPPPATCCLPVRAKDCSTAGCLDWNDGHWVKVDVRFFFFFFLFFRKGKTRLMVCKRL